MMDQQMHAGSSSGKAGPHPVLDEYKYARMESGIPDALAPGFSHGENLLRIGFIRKVYGILSAQLILTAAVAGWIVTSPATRDAIATTPGMMTVAGLAPVLGLIPLFCYRNSHPLNLGLLAIWTCTIALTVGVVTSVYSTAIVFQALVLTACTVVGLTLYTFVGVKKGQDFGFLGPMLFAGLCTLMVASFMQMFFPMGDFTNFLLAVGGAGIFSIYIVYDTNELILRHSVDEYVWASVGLYLDIINLFLKLLQILQYLQGGRD
mmetsp:Transcript_27963/g.46873  ORF Transcript_27963/g.46873 Transcript_27963/m.46873 type:complete len:263 (+) Transcript_27963:170-958(+)|eukprot:CAMPEP_0198209116 /NCGR_PEP_ID=MMETSP1445-20131203/12423_1 /TAXON_ID=36898 /ORGANISM="Pyramimonas sp., Strain CCMP2087" /LENGTH=262 /DNA_ID=CAMNT_0043882757 /DNA_START=167 /DNA_END=955 /DNA_ORIENTATION=+